MQGELLALVLLYSDREYRITELAAELGTTPTAVLREVDRLCGGGIVTARKAGRSRLVKARTDTPLYRPLRDLIAVSFGPVPVLTEALAQVGGVRKAYVYGSWAARYEGEPGPPPADVDVLVVGDPDRDEVFDAAEEASRRLRRDIDIHRIPTEAWEAPTGDPFLTGVRERPLVQLRV